MDEKNLELIETFENGSLYYNKADSSIWYYDGENYFGADSNVFIDWLKNS